MKAFDIDGSNTLSLAIFIDVTISKIPEKDVKSLIARTTYILAARFNASPDEMKAVEKLISGKEIKLEGLEGRANQAQMQKVSWV